MDNAITPAFGREAFHAAGRAAPGRNNADVDVESELILRRMIFSMHGHVFSDPIERIVEAMGGNFINASPLRDRSVDLAPVWQGFMDFRREVYYSTNIRQMRLQAIRYFRRIEQLKVAIERSRSLNCPRRIEKRNGLLADTVLASRAVELWLKRYDGREAYRPAGLTIREMHMTMSISNAFLAGVRLERPRLTFELNMTNSAADFTGFTKALVNSVTAGVFVYLELIALLSNEAELIQLCVELEKDGSLCWTGTVRPENERTREVKSSQRVVADALRSIAKPYGGRVRVERKRAQRIIVTMAPRSKRTGSPAKPFPVGIGPSQQSGPPPL